MSTSEMSGSGSTRSAAADYDAVVAAVAAVPAARRELMLAKSVLLLARHLAPTADLPVLLAAAARDLPDDPNPEDPS